MLLLLAACSDDAPSTPDGSSSTGTPSVDSTSTGTTGDGSSTTTAAADDTSTTTTGEGTGTFCETVLCGEELLCCEPGDSCIDGRCVAGCDSGIRCGAEADACCEAEQVCLEGACVTPGGECIDSFDCDEGEFCEPGIDRCLPESGAGRCELPPPEFQQIELALEWSRQTDQLLSPPLVGDVDGDSLPEVVINSYFINDVNWWAELTVIDGTTGNVQFTVNHVPDNEQYGSYSRTTPAIGDVSGDGIADIVYSGFPESGTGFPNNSSRIRAIDGQGQHLWASHAPDGSPYYVYIRNGGVTLANLDADEPSEIIVGVTIIDHDGTVVFDVDNDDNPLGGAVYGSNGNVTGGMAIATDLDGDGTVEIVSGRQAWTVDWVEGDPPTVTLTPRWEYAGPDGTPAVADLDQDGDPEIILVGDPGSFASPYDGQVQVLDGATGQLWCGIDPTGAMCDGMDALRTQPYPIPGGGRGGPPVVADFDGDGRPEIGLAGGSAYTVYDLNRDGEDVVTPAGDPPPEPGAIYARWSTSAQDVATNVTGSTAFDFQGDGAAEVLYNDQCFLRVFDGRTGDVMVETPNSSWNLHQFPVVADVDDDGDPELLVVANDFQSENTCQADDPGYEPRRGLFVYSDPNDQWVRTRQVWNGHAYHVTNATSRGLVPPAEVESWRVPGLNNYRQNVERAGLFTASDLVVSLSLGVVTCTDDDVEVIATIRNVGAATVPGGIDVGLYRGAVGSGELLNTQPTAQPLRPGADTQLSWVLGGSSDSPLDLYVVVDADAEGAGAINECNEDNNVAVITGVTCPDPS